MVKHIVCFKLKESNDDNKAAAKERLLSMKGKVPMMKDREL